MNWRLAEKIFRSIWFSSCHRLNRFTADTMPSLSEQLRLWKGCFHIWWDAFSASEEAAIRGLMLRFSRIASPRLHPPVRLAPVFQSKVWLRREIFMLIFCLFHFGCKWISAVVLRDCSLPSSGSSLLCVVTRLLRVRTYLWVNWRRAMKSHCAAHFVY